MAPQHSSAAGGHCTTAHPNSLFVSPPTRRPLAIADVGTDSVSGRGAGGSVSDRLSVATGSTAAGAGGPGPASKRQKTAAGGAAATGAGGKKKAAAGKKGGKGRKASDDDDEEEGDDEDEGGGDDDGSVSSGPSGNEPLNA
jgi:hypothetical protein